MDDNKLSKLRVYSVGIVAKNKPLNTSEIEVTPVEDLPMLDGEITDHGKEVEAKGRNRDDSSYNTTAKVSSTIKASWMPVGSANRFTSPDVRRGEYVVIYQFADADKYYWVTFKDDLKLRKLETVIYAFSGTQKENDGVSEATHYFLEISTHKKLVHFHTSKANNEPFAYDIQINTEKGFIMIQDDDGNFFSFDSKERRLELKNRDETHLDIDKKDFTLTVPDNTTIKTGKNTKITTGQNTNIETKGDTVIDTKGNTTVKSGQNTLIDSKGSTTITSVGSISILSKSGNTSMKGAGTMDITQAHIYIDSPVDFLKPITCSKIITGAEITCPSISGVASGLK